MESSGSTTTWRGKRISTTALPLVKCDKCNVRPVKAFRAKTDKNNGRLFYVCSSRMSDGVGCDFWKWQEEYEQLLVLNALVPPSYEPVFESTKLSKPLPIMQSEGEQKKLNRGDTVQEEQVKKLGEIVVLLKCLICVSVLVLLSNLYAIAK